MALFSKIKNLSNNDLRKNDKSELSVKQNLIIELLGAFWHDFIEKQNRN